MTKTELYKAVASKAKTVRELTQTDVDAVLDVLFDLIPDTLAIDEQVAIPGFGTFRAKNRAATKGRNPKTGEVIQISARRVPSFSAGASFKTSVNRKKKK